MPHCLRLSSLAVALAVLTAATLRGQECDRCNPPGDTTHARVRVVPAIGVRVGAPQKASIAVGVLTRAEWQQHGRDYSRNLAAFVEPGLSGARASVAYIQGIGNLGSGFGVAASVLRTWKEPWTLPDNGTYVGGELLVFPLFLVGPRVGLFKEVSGGRDMKRWFFTADFGFGL